MLLPTFQYEGVFTYDVVNGLSFSGKRQAIGLLKKQ